jgi:hypothetical protein
MGVEVGQLTVTTQLIGGGVLHDTHTLGVGAAHETQKLLILGDVQETHQFLFHQ